MTISGAAKDDQPLKGYAVRELHGSRRKIYAVAWNCTGQKMAAGCGDSMIRTWSVEPHCSVSKPERLECELKGHTDVVSHLVWRPHSPDVLASTTGTDRSLRVWDLRSRKCSTMVQTGTGNEYVTWSPDGVQLALSTNKDTVAVVDMRKQRLLREQKMPFAIYEVRWGPSPSQLLMATRAGSVELMVQAGDAGGSGSWEPGWSFKGHASECHCLDVSRDGKTLLSGGADAQVAVWDLDQAVCTRTFYKIEDTVRSVSLSHDSRLVAWGTDGGLVEVASMQSGEVLQTFQVSRDNQKIDSVVWNPVHPVLAFAKDVKEDRGGEPYGVVIVYAPPKSSS